MGDDSGDVWVAWWHTGYLNWYKCVDPHKSVGEPNREGPWSPSRALQVMFRLKAMNPSTTYAITTIPPRHKEDGGGYWGSL